MAKNKKPTKKYRPRGIIKDPIRYVVRGCGPAEESAVTKCQISYHMAMLNITQGKAKPSDWQEIANALNAGIVLAEMGYGKEYLQEFIKAQGAMVMLRDRLKNNGTLTIKAVEMTAINEALAVHDEQIRIATIKDMELAIKEVERQLARRNFVTIKPVESQQPGTLSY
jgi:hypothetical protein